MKREFTRHLWPFHLQEENKNKELGLAPWLLEMSLCSCKRRLVAGKCILLERRNKKPADVIVPPPVGIAVTGSSLWVSALCHLLWVPAWLYASFRILGWHWPPLERVGVFLQTQLRPVRRGCAVAAAPASAWGIRGGTDRVVSVASWGTPEQGGHGVSYTARCDTG